MRDEIFKAVVLLLSIVRFDRDAVLQVTAKGFNFIVDNNQVLQISSKGKDLKILDVYFILFDEKALISRKNVIKILRSFEGL